MKDEMREEGLNEEDAKRCVNFRREMYGFCNYDNAFTGKEEREVMTPVLVLFRPVKKTRQGKVGENESESDSDSDSDEDHKVFNEEDAIELGKSAYAHVYKTPKLTKQLVPKVRIFWDGDTTLTCEEVMERTETRSEGKAGAIVFSCKASLEVLSREFPNEGDIRARDIIEELRVEPTPQIYNCFDHEGRLLWPGRNDKECMVTMSDGTCVFLRNCRSDADGTESDLNSVRGEIGKRVCSVKIAPKGPHLEFWMPNGARAASVGMTKGGSKSKPIPLSFVSRAEGEIWCGATGQVENEDSSSSESEESTEGRYRDMFQLGGTAHVEIPRDEWDRDIQCGIITSRRVPLTGGMKLIGRSSLEEDKILCDTTGIVPAHIFLELVVEQYMSWRLAVLRRLGYDRDYVSVDSFVIVTPGKSDRVNKKKFHWSPQRSVQTACNWDAFEANAMNWLELVAGTTTTQIQNLTHPLREMALHIVSKTRIDPTFRANHFYSIELIN